MSGDGYDVEGSELRAGSSQVQRAAGNAANQGETPDAEYGHPVLHQAVAGFCAAMNTAVEAMLAQAAETSDDLAATASSYSDDDASARNQVVGAGG